MTDTPDFDSMTPEEMMEWMESLAKKQGVTEGLTTAADMQIAEVDEDDERLKDVGEYIPYGWKEADWKAHLAKEEAEKAAKRAAQEAAPPPPPAPVPEPEPPAPEPIAEAPAADGTPDFDSMTPEEMMEWMESLAKKQGVTEGLTTAADMEIADVAEDDERLEGMGEYIPYGWKEADWKAHLAKEEAEKAAKRAAQDTAPPPPAPEPTLEPVMDVEPAAPDFLEGLFNDQNNELPTLEGLDEEETVPADAAPAAANPTDWLSGLTEETAAPELDLSALDSLNENPLAGLDMGAPATDNPMDWLSGLTGDDNNDLSALGALADDNVIPDDAPVASNAPADDPIAWMEGLAARQDADPEELVTNTEGAIPGELDLSGGDDGPGYREYSFENGGDAPSDTDAVENIDFSIDFDGQSNVIGDEEAESWLDGLASSQNIRSAESVGEPDFFTADTANTDDGDDDSMGVLRELESGKDVAPEAIENFFSNMFEEAEKHADRDDKPLEELIGADADEPVDEDATPEANIPDWLREQMGEDVVENLIAETTPADESQLEEQMADVLSGLGEATDEDVPDWLSGDGNIDDGDIDNIFVPESSESGELDAAPVAPAGSDYDPSVNTGDSWVEAFDMEQNPQAVQQLETWYDEQSRVLESGGTPQPVPEVDTSAPATPMSPVPTASAEADAGLQVADLPVETRLPEGEPEAVPDWLSGEEDEELAPAEIDFATLETSDTQEAMPDWLNTSEVEEASIPDWLSGDSDAAEDVAEDVPDWLNPDAAADDDIPDWLRDTMTEEQLNEAISGTSDGEDIDLSFMEEASEPDPTFTPPPQTFAPVPASPAPVPVAVANIDVAATLQEARSQVGAGDIDSSLQNYEAIVRANAALDEVVKDVSKLAEDKNHKKNPTVYRVLGDALMRTGKLQDALDTYRRALNLL